MYFEVFFEFLLVRKIPDCSRGFVPSFQTRKVSFSWSTRDYISEAECPVCKIMEQDFRAKEHINTRPKEEINSVD